MCDFGMDFGNIENIRLKAFCLSVTLRCTLRCKLCIVRAGYYSQPPHPETGHLKKQVSSVYSVISFVDDFNISGGEPFLRNDLAELLTFLRINYKDKMKRCRIFTNGTLLPSEVSASGFYEEAGRWGDDFSVVIDKYIVSDKCDDIALRFKSEGIPFEIRDYTDNLHCDGWADFGDLTLKHTDTDAFSLYQKCAVKQGYYVYMENGVFFACPKAHHLRENNLGNDYVDFLSDLPCEKKKEQLVSLLSRSFFEACKYCNGICEDSERFLPGEQLAEREN